jgi:hypothetical protein
MAWHSLPEQQGKFAGPYFKDQSKGIKGILPLTTFEMAINQRALFASAGK